MVISSAVMKCPRVISNNFKVLCEGDKKSQSMSRDELPNHVNLSKRRDAMKGLSLVAVLALSCGIELSPVWAEEVSDNDEGVIGSLKSLFDPNEKTKTGKVLPKAYLKSARDVVKTLRESLEEDPKDSAKFRRVADSAKEAIREYLSSWRGQQSVSAEESYAELEKAIRALAGFYSKARPSAAIGAEVSNVKGDNVNLIATPLLDWGYCLLAIITSLEDVNMMDVADSVKTEELISNFCKVYPHCFT